MPRALWTNLRAESQLRNGQRLTDSFIGRHVWTSCWQSRAVTAAGAGVGGRPSGVAVRRCCGREALTGPPSRARGSLSTLRPPTLTKLRLASIKLCTVASLRVPRILLYVWALPTTFFGLLLAPLALLTGG